MTASTLCVALNVYDSVDGGVGTDTIKLNGAASRVLSSLGSIIITEILQVEGTSGGGTTVTKNGYINSNYIIRKMIQILKH